MTVEEPPLTTARRYADYDLKKTAGPAETEWLHANPVLWLRALDLIVDEIGMSISTDNLGLSAVKPPSGLHASPEYLAAKWEVDKKTHGRRHVQKIAHARRMEVRSLIGATNALDTAIAGDVVDEWAQVLRAAKKDDFAQIERIAERNIRLWSGQRSLPGIRNP